MEKTVNFGKLFPQVKTMFLANIPGNENLTHVKYSYTYRIFVVTEGCCDLIIDDNEQLCRAGDAVFLCPRQKYTNIFNQHCVTINLVFEFSDKLSETLIPRNSSKYFIRFPEEEELPERYSERLKFTDMPVFNSSFMISGVPGTVDRINEMYKLFAADDLFSHLRLSSLALGFIADIAEYATGLNSQVRNDLAHRVLDFIDTHCGERLTCAKIAGEFSYHPSYINRIIHSYTGFSLHDYVTRRRIRKATKLLTETELSMTEIAYQLSFYDSSHFCKVYQAHVGISPSDVRKKFRDGYLRPDRSEK